MGNTDEKMKDVTSSIERIKGIVTVSQIEVFKNRKRILSNPLPFHNENFEKYGDTFKVNLGGKRRIIFTRDADIILHILQKNQKNYHKSDLQTKDLAKYIGQGLLTSNGEFWRKHRRMIQPAFHKKKLEGLLDIMNAAIQLEVDNLVPNTFIGALPLMGDLAFQVVAQSLFSADDIRKRMDTLKEITIRNQEMLIREMRQPYLKFWFYLSGGISKHLKLSVKAKEILDGIIQQRIDLSEDKDDLLDMLLRATYEDGSNMSRPQLIDEVMILFTAGHETTANVLSFTLYLLAKHPAEQEKLFKEVSEMDFTEHSVTYYLSKFEYTKQCIEETMRLYPPVYVIDRVSLGSEIIKGEKFEEKSVWLMSMYELHRHKKLWNAPDKFMPERFSVENRKAYSDFYFPFGAGPRMCIGNNFAMYEMILAVAQLVKRYKLETNLDTIELNPLISLKPVHVPIKFVPR